MKIINKVAYLTLNLDEGKTAQDYHEFYDNFLQTNNVVDEDVLAERLNKFKGDKTLFKLSTKEVFIESKFKELPFNNRDLVNGDNVFFVPGVTVPRYKFKNKGDEVGFYTKRNIEKSNVVVIDKSCFPDMFDATWKTSANVSTKTLLSEMFSHFNLLNELDNLDNLNVDQTGTDISIVMSQEVYRFLYNFPQDRSRSYCPWYEHLSGRYSSIIDPDKFSEKTKNNFEYLKYALDYNLEIMEGSHINNFLTSEVKADEKMYTRLKQMIISSNQSDTDLAMETLTNLDYEDTLLEMLILLNENGSSMKYSNVWNTVSFKSFRSSIDNLLNSTGMYFSKDAIFNTFFQYTRYIEILGKLKILKEDHLRVLKDEVSRDISQFTGREFFKVTKVNYTPLLQGYLEESKKNLETNLGNEES